MEEQTVQVRTVYNYKKETNYDCSYGRKLMIWIVLHMIGFAFTFTSFSNNFYYVVIRFLVAKTIITVSPLDTM